MTAPLILTAMLLLVVAPLLVFAIWMWRLGVRTIVSGHYPPEGVRMLGRRPELHGEAARRRGRLAQVFAAIFLVLALAFALFTWRLAKLLASA